MTKAKKMLSLVLAVVMVAAMFAFSASAAADTATFTVTVNNASPAPGDVITVTVNLTTSYYAGPTNVPVYYNPAVFEFVAGSVVGTKIFGNGTTDIKDHNDSATGCLKVAFIPDTAGGTAAAKVLNGTLFTFQLRAKANGTSDIGLKAEDQKTSTNVGGTLYCGAYDSSEIDANPATVGQVFTINNTSATVGSAVENTLVVKDTAPSTPTIDTTNNCGYDASIYGMDTLGWNDELTPEGAITDYLTTTLGDEYLRITTPDSGYETTGTIIEVLDADGSTVLKTYVFIYFGDINEDGLVDSDDDFLAAYYGLNFMGIDTLEQLMAGDLDGDAWPTSDDGFAMSYYGLNYTGLPSQQACAEMAVGNYFELI